MEGLTYLLMTYFHQDWDHAHSTWQGVIDEFLTDNPARVAQVPHDIDRLLANTPSDSQLSRAVVQMGMYYSPPEGERAWLAAVKDRIIHSLPGQSSARDQT
ncbi:contact-dependent growth inhibition system immunity protein [Nocardioides sp. 616]|uniref:contact-dependent growth inhibition system immunity protein n=1 Tax=Nocardioides sp. 616 TaxID=2268090 RepID=UPI000CE57333|nr:contact-dependent growth inhibition system immunity protein [Nocardioides sp. 616]